MRTNRATEDHPELLRIMVVGGGFAGVWSALSATRHLYERQAAGTLLSKVEVVLISVDEYLSIRPRLYESDLRDLRVPLDALLSPVGIRRVEGRVTEIDAPAHRLTVLVGGRLSTLSFDRLVLAAGSQIDLPPLPGLAKHAFTVDTYTEAGRLDEHLHDLPARGDDPHAFSAVVIGAGFTGIEVATELIGRLRDLAERAEHRGPVGVTLVDSGPVVGRDIGQLARPYIEHALRQLGVQVRLGAPATEVTASGVTLSGGERLASRTTVWAGGLRASPLTRQLGVATDQLGRLPVDTHLRVAGADHVFAGGDVARAFADVDQPTLMSCQHAIPLGKFAGHNAAADLVGGDMLPYRQPDYVTCLDLGPAGALFTRGWDRAVLFTGAVGKRLKEQINRRDIYPPLPATREGLLEAARPVVVSMDGLIAYGERLAVEAARSA
jgi:NADH:ubiquinone reductase (H+-translocating)